MPPPIRFCRSADGARIAFTATGSGPPLVQAPTWMTHLELDWTTSWQPWLAELSRRHVLVRHDLRGCGLSDRDPCRVDLGAWLADLEAVVDTLNLEKFPLFGLCQGAAIAAAYAARHPERVSRLVLYGGYTRGVLARAPRSPQADEARALAKLIETGWGRETPAFRELFARLLMPDAPETTAMAFAEVERQSAVPKMASRLWLAFHHIDIAATAATIAAPTLVLHSRGDGLVPFDEGRRLAALVPGAHFVPLDGRNHILQPGEPAWERLWVEVHRFLADETAPAGGATFPFPDLTRRERVLLDRIARGRSNAEIAEELAISPKTVRNHITHIFDKIGVTHRAEAIVLAREAGFGIDGPGPESHG